VASASAFIVAPHIGSYFSSYESFDSQNLFFAIGRLVEGFQAIFNPTAGYANSRLYLVITWYDFYSSDIFNWVAGVGAGVSNAYADKVNGGMTLEPNLLAFILNSSGVAGLLATVAALSVMFRRSDISREYKIFVISLFVSGLINPSGVFWQSLAVMSVVIGLGRRRN